MAVRASVVRFENISRFFKLYDSPKDRLKEALHPLGKKFHRDFYALKNINLSIQKGEVLGIVGRNGSGKSTLLKIVCRVIPPTSGEITVEGSVSALLDLGAGLDPEFDGLQNIYFGGIMSGYSREEIKEKEEEIIRFADIGEFIHQPLKTYSAGMKARLGFAMAISVRPEILVIDEILAVGDDLFQRKCHAKIAELLKTGCTVLLVSHNMPHINDLCTRAILLDYGELILEGTPKFVTVHYQKLLYARPEDQNSVRDAIIELYKSPETKANISLGPEKKELGTHGS
jgi:lipopolysaccharide transport system ATP-binding protein